MRACFVAMVMLSLPCLAHARPTVSWSVGRHTMLYATVSDGDGPNHRFALGRWSVAEGWDSSETGLIYLRWQRSAPRPDGTWLPIGGRRLRVVRASDGVTLGEWVPGTGGDFTWVGDRLVHSNGCGTNCQVVRIWDAAGRSRGAWVVECGWALVRGRYLAMAKGWGSEIDLVVVDVLTGKTSPRRRLPRGAWVMSAERKGVRVRWGESRERVVAVPSTSSAPIVDE